MLPKIFSLSFCEHFKHDRLLNNKEKHIISTGVASRWHWTGSSNRFISVQERTAILKCKQWECISRSYSSKIQRISYLFLILYTHAWDFYIKLGFEEKYRPSISRRWTDKLRLNFMFLGTVNIVECKIETNTNIATVYRLYRLSYV